MIPAKTLQQTPLSSVIGHYIKLKNKGRESHAPCPFHDESAPSFSVNDDKGFYHCFGCGAHGNAVGFVMEYLGIEFPQAVDVLEREFSIVIPLKRDASAPKVHSERWTYIWERVIRSFEYWRQRLDPEASRRTSPLFSLSPEILDEYQIGYAPKVTDKGAYWAKVLPGQADRDALSGSRLTGDRQPSNSTIIPVADRVGYRGFYAVDGQHVATWFGQKSRSEWLFSHLANSTIYSARKNMVLTITDDVQVFFQMVSQGIPSAVMPWPLSRYCADNQISGLLKQWPKTHWHITRDTAFLYDHAFINGVLVHHRNDTRVWVTESQPNVLPLLDKALPLDEYLVSRSIEDANPSVPGVENRFRQLSAFWLDKLPKKDLYRFVISEQMASLNWPSTGGHASHSSKPWVHPLSLTDYEQAIITVAKKYPIAAKECLQELSLPAKRIVTEVIKRGRLSPVQSAQVAGLIRLRKLPETVTSLAAAFQYLDSVKKKLAPNPIEVPFESRCRVVG